MRDCCKRFFLWARHKLFGDLSHDFVLLYEEYEKALRSNAGLVEALGQVEDRRQRSTQFYLRIIGAIAVQNGTTYTVPADIMEMMEHTPGITVGADYDGNKNILIVVDLPKPGDDKEYEGKCEHCDNCGEAEGDE